MRDIVERLETQAFVADKTQSGMAPLFEECLDEITRLRAENEKLRDAYDTDALTISYNLGYTCGKDIAKDEIERLRGLLREAHVKMVENDLWVNLRQRVAAAIRESEAKP